MSKATANPDDVFVDADDGLNSEPNSTDEVDTLDNEVDGDETAFDGFANGDKEKIIESIEYDAKRQWEDDLEALEATKAFFNNEYTLAESLFQKKVDVNPLYALGMAALGVAKAFMTFNESDAVAATSAVRRADFVASTQLSFLGFNDSFFSVATAVDAVKSVASASANAFRFIGKGIFGGGNGASAGKKATASLEPSIPPPALRAVVFRAEATLLSAVLQAFQENITSLIRAGLRFRRSYKALQSAWGHVSKLLPSLASSNGSNDDSLATGNALLEADLSPLREKIDGHTLGAVLFTVGSQNLFLSILPRKILVLVQFLGFQGNRHLGLALLEKCTHSDDIHTGLALLVLSAYYGLFSSFAPIFLRPSQIGHAQRVARRAAELYPTSLLHKYVGARIKRLGGDVEGCIADLEDMERRTEASPDSKSKFAAQHLSFYELGISYAFQCQWQRAREFIQRLIGQNYWSSAFCHYYVASCYAMEGDSEHAKVYFERAPEQVKRKFGGKVIAVEQFVLKKCAAFKSEDYASLDLTTPLLELLYIWNCFPSFSATALQYVIDHTSSIIAKYEAREGDSAFIKGQLCVKRAIRAQALRELTCQKVPFYSSFPQLSSKASFTPFPKNELDSISADMDWALQRESSLKSVESWLAPFVYYDKAALAYTLSRAQMNQPTEDYAKALNLSLGFLETSKKYGGYIFEFRLETRIHLAKLKLSEQLEKL